MQDNTIFEDKNNDEVEVIEAIRTSPLKESSEEPQKKRTFWNRIAENLREARRQFSTTYSKRNAFANALLSLYLLATFLLASFLLFSSLMSFVLMYSYRDGYYITVGIAGLIYTCLCFYFNYRFVICNRKNAVWLSVLCSSFLWFIVLWAIALLYSPDDYEDEGSRSTMMEVIDFIWPLVLYGIFCLCVYGVIRLIMSLKKYGASAWSLLDVSRRKRPGFEKVFIWLFFLSWLLPVCEVLIRQYQYSHPADKFQSHSTARIGDYYYEDGTISSELLTDKKAVGVVFSLEVSDKDRIMGYNHGQIVSLTDISSDKMPWDSSDTRDYEKYPNYTWENRMDALNDIDGLEYVNCEGFTCLSINWDAMKYMENEIEGISGWYVPTSGQWAKILENLANVKVNQMLKFDAETASKNLEVINIDPQRWYWTITEFDADNAWSIRVANGEFGSRSNKQNGAYIRPVASF